MKSYYENLSDEELIKKRALGSEVLTKEAQDIIAKILKDRGCDVPPLFEKSIDIEMIGNPNFKNNSNSKGIFQAVILIVGALVASEFVSSIMKNSGIIVNVIFLISACVIWLLIRHQKQSMTIEDELSDKLGKDGFNELMLCSVIGNTNRIKEILMYKPDVDMADSKGYTALMYAASNGQDEVVKLLLNNSADKNIQSNKGSTALDFAMKNKHTNIISLLS